MRSLSPLAMRVGWVSFDRSSGAPRPHFLIAWSCVCALILVALLRKSPLNYGDLSTVQQPLALEKESK